MNAKGVFRKWDTDMIYLGSLSVILIGLDVIFLATDLLHVAWDETW